MTIRGSWCPLPCHSVRALRLEPGQIFRGAYRVVRVLGRGSMGVVYLVETEDGQRRALKLLLPEALRDERAMERFQREATASQQIRSEHVVKTLEAGVDAGSQIPWLLMEYVEGETLEAFCASGPPVERRRMLLDQLFRGITAVHEAGFVHRDLKPENLLLCPAPGGFQLKVLDFGVAKRLGMSPNNSTAQGLGTPLWTAPEQTTERRGISPSADVWALGLLAFYALTGRLYWRGANVEKVGVLELILEMNQGASTAASERLRELGGQGPLPPGFDAWFQRCVHRDPAVRFPHAGEAHRYLTELLEQRRSTLPAAPASSLPPPPRMEEVLGASRPRARGLRGPVLAALAVGAALALVLLAALALR